MRKRRALEIIDTSRPTSKRLQHLFSVGIFVVLFITSDALDHFGNTSNLIQLPNNNNYSTTDNIIIFHTFIEEEHNESDIVTDVSINGGRNDTNISHLKRDWTEWNPKLKFPGIDSDQQYKMANLHLNRGIFIFDFLRKFLSFIQPYDVSIDLLTDAIENRINKSRLISELIRLEGVLLAVVGVCCILVCIIPGIELWLACRPIREDYQPTQHPKLLIFLLAFFVVIIGAIMITMIVCNEIVSKSVEKFPIVIETALEDLNDYHSSTTIQLRKCLSRSLDVASEAILADLDNIEELLGKPVQNELASETGLDAALDALIDVGNVTQKVSNSVEALLNYGENIRSLGKQLNMEVNDLRRNLEGTLDACTGQDRPLCTLIDSSGLRVTLRMDQFVRDDFLLRLRDFKQENLTETIRQARGEYLYIPQHIARNSLEVRNQIRREVNKMRARIFDEARNMEASNSDLIKQLESARRLVDYVTPYIIIFEHIRWLIGTILCVLLIWLLLFGALCCGCSSSEHKMRPILLCSVFVASFISIILWVVFIMTLILSSHVEMLICRPLHDPEFNIIEAILQTRMFLGKKLSIPLKDLFKKCQENEPAYPAFGLGNVMKLEQLTAYWTWSSFSRIIHKLKIKLMNLKIFTPHLQRQLLNLLYACGLNLTEHRMMTFLFNCNGTVFDTQRFFENDSNVRNSIGRNSEIQGRILHKDLEALSDQLDKVTRQMSDRLTARSLETAVANMQDLNLRRLKPLAKLQDMLLYKLAGLELQIQPLQRQVNQSISQLKAIEYYIQNQADKIAQLSGYWFSTFLCIVIMIVSTPIAHILSLVYKTPPDIAKDANQLATRSEDRQTEVNEQETWHTPE
ncbi:Prom1 [Anthophora plagiata]